MTWVHRCIIAPASQVDTMRQIATSLGENGESMWIRALSPINGSAETHYISSGFVGSAFAESLVSPNVLKTSCSNAEIPLSLTLKQCQSLLSECDISEEQPLDVLRRLGLTFLESQL